LNVPDKWAILDSVMGVGGLPAWHQGFDHFFDNFQVRTCHNLPLPCQANNSSNCITEDLAQWVFEQGSWEYDYVLNRSPLAKQLAQVGIGGFMSTIRDVIVATISGNSSASSIGTPQFAYYSGHDTTIGAVLGFLNVTGIMWPPYASTMQFELWQANSSEAQAQPSAPSTPNTSQYFVRVIYNGAVLPMYAANCCNDLCPVDDFLTYVNSMIPENLVQICQGDGLRNTGQ
jgi:acid phosphatase